MIASHAPNFGAWLILAGKFGSVLPFLSCCNVIPASWDVERERREKIVSSSRYGTASAILIVAHCIVLGGDSDR